MDKVSILIIAGIVLLCQFRSAKYPDFAVLCNWFQTNFRSATSPYFALRCHLFQTNISNCNNSSAPSIYNPSNNFATANAAPAASAPMSITRNAPCQGFTPVILLLKNPKTKRHNKVTAAEIFNPFSGECAKK